MPEPAPSTSVPEQHWPGTLLDAVILQLAALDYAYEGAGETGAIPGAHASDFRAALAVLFADLAHLDPASPPGPDGPGSS